jgi:hypothetical protein
MQAHPALKILGFFLVLMIIGARGTFAQSNQDFTSELVWGVNKNTNGGLIGGVMAKYTRPRGERWNEFFGLELSNVKHPKEVRFRTFIGNSYIWGKQNYLYAVRPNYGREYVLFKKAQQQGVQVSALGAIGPSLGIVAPYYIEVAVDAVSSVREPFDPTVHVNQSSLLGTGRLLQGITESQLELGAHVRLGLNFEFGAFRSNVTGVEIGVMHEAYQNEIIIIPTASNRSQFTSAYATLYFGRRN